MKRRILLSIIALCGYIGMVSAQEYEYVPLVREGVEWIYSDRNFERFRFEGDTLINGKQYYKCNIYHSCEDENPQRSGYFREENKKVYFIADHNRVSSVPEGNTEEVLLYDFTPTQVGDKIVIGRAGAMEEEYMVTKIDTVLVDGSLKKRIELYYYHTFIEGIGGVTEGSLLDMPFVEYPPCTGCPVPPILSCVKKESGEYEFINYGTDPCEEGAIEDISTPTLHIAQHPNQWVVTLPSDDCRMVEVIDTSGRVAWCEYLDGNTDSIAISTANLARGIYIVTLTAESGERITRKVAL